MFYYGIHSTDDLDDGYMGSGKRLKAAIKKYGVENFEKEILKFFDTLSELSEYEQQVVNENLLNDKNCYNLVKGGYFLDNESIIKRHKAFKDICHQQGENNSQYGKCWIKKDGLSKTIYKEELPCFLNNGWEIGRVILNKSKITEANRGRRHIWKDGKSISVYEKDLQEYLNNGWVIGRMDPNLKKYSKKSRLSKDELKSLQKKAGKKLSEYNKTYIKVIDKDGNIFVVDKSDQRYIKNELMSVKKGMVAAIDEYGNSYYVNINDPRYVSGELKPKCRSNLGKVCIKDVNGNYYQVYKDDPRLNDSNYTTSTTGLKYTIEQREKISKSKTDKKRTWINNGNIHKFIPIDEIDNFLKNNSNWMRGRIKK